jgi:hypothetical protein
MTPAEARRVESGTSVVVTGYVYVEPDGRARVCDALAESFPPQCAGPALELVGLDADDIPSAQHGSGVTWSGQQVRVHGTTDGDTLTVDGVEAIPP